MEATPSARFRWLRLTPDRAVPGLLALEGVLILAERFGWFTFDRHKGYAPLATIAAVGAALFLMLLWFLVAITFRRRFQFSLRSLLLLVLVVAIPCSWLAVEMKAAREQRAAVAAIEKLGGWVNYDYEYEDIYTVAVPPKPGPAWLRARLGVDLFANVTVVSLNSRQSKFGDAGLEHVKALTQLQWLFLGGTKISDAGLENFKGLTQLRCLCLTGTKVSDAGLEHLEGLAKLQKLGLDGTKVSDAGLKHLKGLPQLECLVLSDTKVTDAGLEHLKGLTQLRYLYLSGTKASDAGIRRLQGVLPNTAIWR